MTMMMMMMMMRKMMMTMAIGHQLGVGTVGSCDWSAG